MKEDKKIKMLSCGWAHWHEVLGLILVIIATLLTLATHNACGIVALFVAGVFLCCYRHVCHCHHGHHVDDESCLHCDEDEHDGKKGGVKK